MAFTAGKRLYYLRDGFQEKPVLDKYPNARPCVRTKKKLLYRIDRWLLNMN
jgi:hypothetical protein